MARIILTLAVIIFIGIPSASTLGSGLSQKWYPAPVNQEPVKYYYYPGQQVYYSLKDYKYYYIDGQVWKSSKLGVPSWITLGDRVLITLNSQKPYYDHAKVLEEYPPPNKKN